MTERKPIKKRKLMATAETYEEAKNALYESYRALVRKRCQRETEKFRPKSSTLPEPYYFQIEFFDEIKTSYRDFLAKII